MDKPIVSWRDDSPLSPDKNLSERSTLSKREQYRLAYRIWRKVLYYPEIYGVQSVNSLTHDLDQFDHDVLWASFDAVCAVLS